MSLSDDVTTPDVDERASVVAGSAAAELISAVMVLIQCSVEAAPTPPIGGGSDDTLRQTHLEW